jgi:hypothetical protein
MIEWANMLIEPLLVHCRFVLESYYNSKKMLLNALQLLKDNLQ